MTTNINTAATPNGRPRRSLNDTIGKLDAMIDGLSDAIPECIQHELKVSIGAAVADGVRGALVEIFHSSEVQTLIRKVASPEPAAPIPVAAPMPAPPSLRQMVQRTGQAVATAGGWVGQKIATAATAVAERARNVARGTASALARAWEYRRPLGVALVIGCVAAATAAAAPSWVGAALSGIGAGCAAVAVEFALWVRRLFGYTPQSA